MEQANQEMDRELEAHAAAQQNLQHTIPEEASDQNAHPLYAECGRTAPDTRTAFVWLAWPSFTRQKNRPKNRSRC